MNKNVILSESNATTGSIYTKSVPSIQHFDCYSLPYPQKSAKSRGSQGSLHASDASSHLTKTKSIPYPDCSNFDLCLGCILKQRIKHSHTFNAALWRPGNNTTQFIDDGSFMILASVIYTITEYWGVCVIHQQ